MAALTTCGRAVSSEITLGASITRAIEIQLVVVVKASCPEALRAAQHPSQQTCWRQHARNAVEEKDVTPRLLIALDLVLARW